MEKEDLSFLNQLVSSMEKSEEKLEEAYKKGNSEEFNKAKKFMLQIQKQISEVLG